MIFERAPEDTLQPIGQGFFGADFLLKKNRWTDYI